MADWKDDNKGLGPWDFIEQLDKWGYLNNPRWSAQADAQRFCGSMDLPLDSSDQHKPCGHWHKLHIPVPFPSGKWVAAMQQPGTPYIYVYDILYKAVIQIDTSEIPVVVSGRLELNSVYDLDYDMGQGNPGAQRGGYCMNKDATRIWYLFTELTGDRSDAELIEVDISGFLMEKVKSTLFPNLVPSEAWPSNVNERINDGCSDDTHTYWCTNLIAGRIIKIRNNEHSIVDDHTFNYPLECGHGGGGFNGPIATIDVNKSTGKLYWVYCRDHIFCIPIYNACRHLIRADLDLVADIDNIVCGSGFSTPAWQNMIRIYSNYVLYHWGYHPFSSPLGKWNLDFSGSTVIHQEHLQNIFGVKDGKVFTLMHLSSIDHPAFLYCINFSDMGEVSKLNVSYYTGQVSPFGDPYDWDWTSVSAMNYQTGVIAIIRYNSIDKINYVACFNADEDLGLLCDVGLNSLIDNLAPIRNEPQVWPMPE